ncbi:hypothetical protein GMMP15_610002 [Candidatus Magnetomoraceae bacterium gMMP-15]
MFSNCLSNKTRIETSEDSIVPPFLVFLIAYPLKQGLKQFIIVGPHSL